MTSPDTLNAKQFSAKGKEWSDTCEICDQTITRKHIDTNDHPCLDNPLGPDHVPAHGYPRD